MKAILLMLCILMVPAILITGMFIGIIHNIFIICGEYVVRKDEIVLGNLGLAFAQVTLEEGSHIEGEVLSFSSAVDVRGTVAGNISSIGSDIKLGKPAKTNVVPRVKSVFFPM